MSIKAKHSIFVFLGLVVLYLVASGCATINLTADDRLSGKIQMRSRSPIHVVHFEFEEPTGDLTNAGFRGFKQSVEQAFTEKGYVLVRNKENVDLTVYFTTHFYRKRIGQILLLFFCLPMDFPEYQGINGVRIQAYFKTDSSRSHKRYQVYYGNKDQYYAKISGALLDDIATIVTKGGAR